MNQRYDVAVIRNDKVVSLTQRFPFLRIEGMRRESPHVNTVYNEQYQAITTQYEAFEIELAFMIQHDNFYDYKIRRAELESFFADTNTYYLVESYMPGIKYHVQYVSMSFDKPVFFHTRGTVTFKAFEACGQSIGSTLNPREINFNTWQFQQGLLADDYEYTFNHSIFSVYNLGDFDVDPREHYLKIVIKGEADGGLQLYNRTTHERFIFNQSLDKNKGDTLEINGVYTYLNGVLSGIDTNGELITLKSGKNDIELFGVGSPEISFDFHFRHK